MKRTACAFIFLIVFVFPGSSFADSVFPLGYSHIIIGGGNVYFTNSDVDDLELDDANFFGGSMYVSLAPKVYLGGEYHRAEKESRFLGGKAELEFNPIEINLKYSQLVNDYLVLNLGGGISRTFIEEKITTVGSVTKDGWFHGVQLFAGVDVLFDNTFVGFYFKWQTMDDFTCTSYDYSNFRLGAHVGFTF